MPRTITDNARDLRRNQTKAESKLWAILRSRKLVGFKFRRQVPIEHFIADFCCYSVKVIVELDGDSHCERLEYDRQREKELRGWGFHVLRYENCVVVNEENRVVEENIFTCKQRSLGLPIPEVRSGIPVYGAVPLTPNPSPAEGEGNKAETKIPTPAVGEGDKSNPSLPQG